MEDFSSLQKITSALLGIVKVAKREDLITDKSDAMFWEIFYELERQWAELLTDTEENSTLHQNPAVIGTQRDFVEIYDLLKSREGGGAR